MSGVATATLKYYIREGLLPGPEQRTSRNMAYYDARLAERVRTIKDLQQRHELPLRFIAQVLEPPPSSRIRMDLDATEREQLGVLAPVPAPSVDVELARSEVLATLSLSEEELSRLEATGLVRATYSDQRAMPVYCGADLAVLEVIADLRMQGLGELVPVDLIDQYVQAIRALVRLELTAVRRHVERGESARAMRFEDAAPHAGPIGRRLLLALRDKLWSEELRAALQADLAGNAGKGRPSSR